MTNFSLGPTLGLDTTRQRKYTHSSLQTCSDSTIERYKSQDKTTFTYGANYEVVGKCDAHKLSYPGAFQPRRGNFKDLATHIGKGHPWMPARMDKGARRSKEAANYAEILGADIDHGMTRDEAIVHPFISKHVGLIIESASSKPEHHKLRLGFRLAQPVRDWETIGICNQYLIHSLEVADKSCKDASRFFFGSPGREPFYLNENACLPDDFVQRAIEWHQSQVTKKAPTPQSELNVEGLGDTGETSKHTHTQRRCSSNAKTRELALEALRFIPPRVKDSGTYAESLNVLMALVDYFGPDEAERIAEQWSPSQPGTTWNIGAKIKSFKRSGITIATLFAHAKKYGFKFPKREKCELTFPKTTQTQTEGFELSERDEYIHKRDNTFKAKCWEDLKRDSTLTPTDGKVINYYQGYAPIFELTSPTIELRGWLGSGKTEATLRSLLPHKDKQILWLTGRNGLLRQTAERARAIGFENVYHYQDNPRLYREMLRDGYPGRYGGIYTMCPDSFKDYATKDAEWSQAIVVIDEFSGVRREVLKKTAIMPEFQRLLRGCKYLIAVDAFLSDVDAGIIKGYRGDDRIIYDQEFVKSPKKITWLESRTKSGDISLSDDGIEFTTLKQWMEELKTVAIATDNKLRAKAIYKFLTDLGYKGIQCNSETVESNRLVLADPDGTIANEEAKFFVYTPMAQSGLDVQTPFDVGLALYGGIISPHDMLQMIGRCRQCKEWYVSAPRRSVDPGATLSLNALKVKQWAEKLKPRFEELEAKAEDITTHWGMWQELTGNIEKSFSSEYLFSLLEQYFETIETLEVAKDAAQWMALRKSIRRTEAIKRLTANLSNGERLLREQKAPATDAQVWDVELAKQHEKYPGTCDICIAGYGDEKTQDEALEYYQKFFSKRLEKLKNREQATGADAASDLELLKQSIKGHFMSPSSPKFKRLQMLTLFRHFNLDKLATARKGTETTAHKTHFRYDSPIVIKGWEKFCKLKDLKALFPMVDSPFQFWGLIKSAMRFFGYQGNGTTIRVPTPGKLHPNGKDRNGNARFVESESIYFSGWLPMAESGNAFFRENYELIIAEITDRLDRERKESAEYRERCKPPPIAA